MRLHRGVSSPSQEFLAGARHPDDPERTTRAGLVTGLTLVATLVVALTVGDLAVGFVLLFLIFVPLEKVFALHPQRIFRRGYLTDLTHFVVNNLLVTIASIGFIIVASLPFLWVRSFDVAGMLPGWAAVAVALACIFIGTYWGHRIFHEVPYLWRYHAVHHSIAEMDWLAAGRLHPLDAGLTQAFGLLPLFLLGYEGEAFAGAAIFYAFLAIFQHANVRLRFPVVRWIVNTPEWHHWHHATDPEARDKNFGLPLVDWMFGTAYMPKGKRPTAFGIDDPVPPTGYVRQLGYPFSAKTKPRTKTVDADPT